MTEVWVLSAAESAGYGWYEASAQMTPLAADLSDPPGWDMVLPALKGEAPALALGTAPDGYIAAVSGLLSQRTRGQRPVRETFVFLTRDTVGLTPVVRGFLIAALLMGENPDMAAALGLLSAAVLDPAGTDRLLRLDPGGFRRSLTVFEEISSACPQGKVPPVGQGIHRDSATARRQVISMLDDDVASAAVPGTLLLAVTTRHPKDLSSARVVLTSHPAAAVLLDQAADSEQRESSDDAEDLVAELLRRVMSLLRLAARQVQRHLPGR